MGKIDMGFIKLSYECSDLIEEIKGDISEFGEECEAEGYPSYGTNYDLRCSDARRYYDELIEKIDSKYGEMGEKIFL